MELFDKKFVHFTPDEELIGKKVFVADDISTLISSVNSVDSLHFMPLTGIDGKGVFPFIVAGYTNYKFAYYDPNYECKVAHARGKQVQVLIDSTFGWSDIEDPSWSEASTYRIKPETETEPKAFKLGDTVAIRNTALVGMITACDLNNAMFYVAGYWREAEELSYECRRTEL